MRLTPTLSDIAIDYFEKRSNGQQVMEEELYKQLSQCRVPRESIDEIILELDDDWTKEEIMRTADRSPKLTIVLGLSIALAFIAISILSALGYLFQGRISLLLFGAITAALATAAKGYFSLKDTQKRSNRRKDKWEILERNYSNK